MSPDRSRRHKKGARGAGVRRKLGQPTRWNRYSYAIDDPVNRADPRGLDDCTVDDGGETVCYYGDDDQGGGGSDDGGGDGTGDDTADDTNDDPQLKQALGNTVQQQINASTNCEQVLQEYLQELGIGESLGAIADNTSVYNQVTEGNTAIGSLPGAAAAGDWGLSATETITQYVQALIGSLPNSVTFEATVLGTSIIIGPGVNLSDSSDVNSTLWHEFWHVATQQSDKKIVQGLIDPNFSGNSVQASTTFDNWLQGGCVSSSGSQ